MAAQTANKQNSIPPKASLCRTGNSDWAYAAVAPRCLRTTATANQSVSHHQNMYIVVLTLICQEGNSSCIQLLMLSDISTSAARARNLLRIAASHLVISMYTRRQWVDRTVDRLSYPVGRMVIDCIVFPSLFSFLSTHITGVLVQKKPYLCRNALIYFHFSDRAEVIFLWKGILLSRTSWEPEKLSLVVGPPFSYRVN